MEQTHKTEPYYWTRLERPQCWKYSDALMHSMHHPYLLNKAQCKYRKEEFELTFDDYYELWKDYWHLRGRNANDYCMTRNDPKLGWTASNTILVLRKEHLKRSKFTRGSK